MRRKKPNTYEILEDGVTVRMVLTKGLHTLFDLSDLPIVMERRWCARQRGELFYATDSMTREAMHHVLIGHESQCTDHKNLDALDNRRINLRPATKAQNSINRVQQANNTSGYKGVSRSGKGWRAYTKNAGKQIWLGVFATKEAAAVAYNEAVLRMHGEYARLNKV